MNQFGCDWTSLKIELAKLKLELEEPELLNGLEN